MSWCLLHEDGADSNPDEGEMLVAIAAGVLVVCHYGVGEPSPPLPADPWPCGFTHCNCGPLPVFAHFAPGKGQDDFDALFVGMP